MAHAIIHQHIDFGAGGNSTAFIGQGWAPAETDSTWALAPRSVLRVPVPRPDAGPAVLMLTLHPLGFLLNLPHRQALTLRVRGETLFSAVLTESTTIAIPLPPTMAGEVAVEFTYPDYRAPQQLGVDDTRQLGVFVAGAWVIALGQPWSRPRPVTHAALSGGAGTIQDRIQHATGLAPKDLMMRFESLGHCCDFGLAQRQCGAEPLSLLRFAGISTPNLIRGLLTDFKGLGQPGNIRPYVPDWTEEFWILEADYGLHYHTFTTPAETTAEKLIKRETARLPFLQRKFLEDLKLAEKIFVLRRPTPLLDGEALAVFAALNLHGPNTLLVVNAATGAQPGSLTVLGPHAMTAELGPDGTNAQIDHWLSLCALAIQAKTPALTAVA